MPRVKSNKSKVKLLNLAKEVQKVPKVHCPGSSWNPGKLVHFPGRVRSWTSFSVKKKHISHVSQVEAPVEMSSFSVVLPCAFEGEFAEKTVWAVWENTAPWFWKWFQIYHIGNGRGMLDRFWWLLRERIYTGKGIFQKIPPVAALGKCREITMSKI